MPGQETELKAVEAAEDAAREVASGATNDGTVAEQAPVSPAEYERLTAALDKQKTEFEQLKAERDQLGSHKYFQ